MPIVFQYNQYLDKNKKPIAGISEIYVKNLPEPFNHYGLTSSLTNFMGSYDENSILDDVIISI